MAQAGCTRWRIVYDGTVITFARKRPASRASKAALRKRPNWSRLLPQPLQILDENEKPIITLKTLGDVRKMLLGLSEAFQLNTTWGHVGVMLDEAARGGDIMDVVVPLRMVLGMEGVACRPR